MYSTADRRRRAPIKPLMWLLLFVISSQQFVVRAASSQTKDSGHNDTATLDALKMEVEESLHDHTKLLQDLELSIQGEEKLQETIHEAQEHFTELISLTRSADDLLRSKINVMAVRHLQDELERIRAEEKEVREKAKKPGMAQPSAQVVTGNKKKKSKNTSHLITSEEELEQLLTPDKVFAEHDSKMEKWCREIMVQAMEELDFPQVTRPSCGTVNDRGDGCASPTQAAQLIQSALLATTHEPLYDHASHAAWIVHEFTSETFQPTHDSRAVESSTPWWLEYLPEDWITTLAYLKTGVYDEENSQENEKTVVDMVSGLTTGLLAGTSNPPETVLHPLVLPGACWPVAKNSNKGGFLTLALPYTISVSAITVDHASRLLMMNQQDSSSAPKKINVIGYPSCPDNDCQGLTFDPSEPLSLMQLEYDRDSKISQTFVVDYENESDSDDGASCSASVDNGDNDDKDDDESTQMDATSCSAPLVPSATREDKIAALRFEIVENYGNQDFTCIYRLRVHGDVSEEDD